MYMSFISNHDVYMLLNNTWCWKCTCIPWLYCRNGMRDPENVGLIVWRGKEGRDVETGEPWQPRVVSQNKCYGPAELLCKFVEIDSNTFTYTCNTTTYLTAEVSGVRRNEYRGHWWGCAGYRIWFDTWLMLVAGPSDLLQHGPCSYKLKLWVGGRIHLTRKTKGANATSGTRCARKLERGGGLSVDDFHVAVVEGGRAPPGWSWRLQRLAVFKASGTETNLLGNQQWRLHPPVLQNGVWGWLAKRDIWSAPLRGTGTGLVRQRWQGSPESNWTQSAEGCESDEIKKKCLTQEEIWSSHPIQSGLSKHTQTFRHPYISKKSAPPPTGLQQP